MIVFGLILVVLAVGAGVALFLATDSLTTPVDLEFAGYNWGMTPLALLITGAVVMLLFWFGLGMIRGSAKRKRRPVREAKEADRQAKIEESIRADERARAEETHQAALAERDRVRDEEFSTRLADRDRERDSEFASREQEFTARERAAEQRARDNEERVRAEERRKVEQEYASRTTALAGTAGAVTTDDESSSGRHSSDAVTDSVDGERQVDDSDVKPSAVAAADSDVERGDDAAPDDDAADHDAADHDGAEQGSSHPGYRTVADKIMGRDPVDRG